MSERFPPLQIGDELGCALENKIAKFFGPDAGFTWKDSKGAPIGPFAVIAYTPDIFPPYLKLADAVMQQKRIEPRSRELAVLAVTAVFNVPFIQYAHEQVGMKVGLSREQVASAVAGSTPEGLTDTEVIIYDTALKLARARGPLDKETWHVAESKLGKECAARVGHIVAWFAYNCTLLNLGAVDVPSHQVSETVVEPVAFIASGFSWRFVGGSRLFIPFTLSPVVSVFGPAKLDPYYRRFLAT